MTDLLVPEKRVARFVASPFPGTKPVFGVSATDKHFVFFAGSASLSSIFAFVM